MFGAGITGLGVAWIVTTTMAIAAVRRGLIEQHQDWMIRSYVVTFAFVTFRVLWTLLQSAGIGTLQRAAWCLQLVLLGRAPAGRRGRAARAQDGWRPSLERGRARPGAVGHAGVRPGTGESDRGRPRGPRQRTSRAASSPAPSSPIVNTETDVARTIETDTDGRFRALALPPGSYSISARSTGFAHLRRDGIVLLLGQSASARFHDEAGRPSRKASPSSPRRPSSTPATPRSPPWSDRSRCRTCRSTAATS